MSLQRIACLIIAIATCYANLQFGRQPALASLGAEGSAHIDFAEPPTFGAPWRLVMWFVSYVPIDSGLVTLELRSRTAGTVSGNWIDTVWCGAAMALDTIRLLHEFAPVDEGEYKLILAFVPHPEQLPHPRPIYANLYARVTPTKTFVSRGSAIEPRIQEIRLEIEQRGLEGVSDEEIWRRAPDLARRLDRAYISNGANTVGGAQSSPGTGMSDTVRTGPARSTLEFGGMVADTTEPPQITPMPPRLESGERFIQPGPDGTYRHTPVSTEERLRERENRPPKVIPPKGPNGGPIYQNLSPEEQRRIDSMRLLPEAIRVVDPTAELEVLRRPR